jgi:hypothetical protein
MLVFVCAGLLALPAPGAPDGGAPAPRGPFALHDPYPLSTLRLEIVPDLPRPAAPGDLRADLAAQAGNTFSVNLPGLEIDAEQWQFWPSAELGIAPGLAMKIEAPLVRRGAGALDGFLDDYHDGIGLTTGARDDVKPGGFSIRRDGGSRGFDLDRAGGLGDVRAALRWAGSASDAGGPEPAFGGRLLARFPTAAERALGSPGADVGAAADGAWDLGGGAILFATLGGMYYARPEGEGVPFARVHATAAAGVDVPLAEGFALVAQASARTTRLRVDGALGRPAELWALGVRLRVAPGTSLEAAFLESFTPLYTTIDAGAHAALRFVF